MREILLQGKVRRVTLVDDEDHDWLSKFRWYFLKNERGGYAVLINPCVYMHRLILDSKDGEEVDHINGIGLDNQRHNLRSCTSAQNKHNRTFKGYTYNKNRRKWQVQLQKIYYGLYDTEEEAKIVSEELKLKMYGEYARL